MLSCSWAGRIPDSLSVRLALRHRALECHAAATTERSAVVWRPTNAQCPLLEEGGNLPLDSVRMIKDFAFTDSQAG